MKKAYLKPMFIIMISLCFFFLIGSNMTSSSIIASAEEHYILVSSYETKKDYDYSKSEPVDEMSFGKESLGKFKVSGNTNSSTKYKDTNEKEYVAYGLSSGQLSFSYEYDGYLLDENGEHYLADETRKKYNGAKLGAKINKGILNIQKSFDGDDWENVGNPIVNFFEDNQDGVTGFYTTDGKDLAIGTFYRVTIAYMTSENIDWKLDPDTYHIEVYEFFACTNTGRISLHDIGNDVKSYNSDEYSVEVLEKGETIYDGGTTISGFKIDTLGASYTVTVNGKEANDGDKFTNSGKYIVKAKTKLGKETTTTVYVFKGGNDKGKSSYFNDYLVAEDRIFRDEYKVPVFGRDAVAKIKDIKDSIPALSGTIRNTDTGSLITLDSNKREAAEYKLSPGSYKADLYSGKANSGSVYHYIFNFVVLDEESKPYANKHNLDVREELQDFKLQHYEVAYETTRGGCIYVCFDSYDEAFKYAYQIEKRYLEHKADGIYYWQDKGNSNQKIKYPNETKADKLKLTAVINENAKKNIEIAYFDPSEEFSYQTFDESIPFSDALEDRSIADSARVFPSEEEKTELLSNDMPIINGYTFMHVGDYDVKSVTAKCAADGKEYDIELSKPIDEQLSVSSVYKITETNNADEKNTYEVIYLAQNKTTVDISKYFSDKRDDIHIDSASSDTIKSGSICIDNVENELDDMSIVKVESDVYGKLNTLVCPIDDIKGLVLYKQGKYKLTFIDRVGNRFAVDIEIGGTCSLKDIQKDNMKTYTEIYNSIHLNHRIEED